MYEYCMCVCARACACMCICRYLPQSIAKTISTALVASRLDYCNSLFHNIAIKDATQLQRVQN